MSGNGLSANEYVVTTKELSEIMNLSPRRIQQLAKQDALVRVGRGKYDLPSSVQAYVEYMTEVPAEELDKSEEETLWIRARRLKAELEYDVMLGNVHRSEDVEAVMNDMLGSFRAQLLVLPGKVAPLLLSQTDVEVIKNTVKIYVYEAMKELSEYNPNDFYEKSKDNLSDENNEGEALKAGKGTNDKNA